MARRHRKTRQRPFRPVLTLLVRRRGVRATAREIGYSAAQVSRVASGKRSATATFLDRLARLVSDQASAAGRTYDRYSERLHLPSDPSVLPTDALLDSLRSRALDARAELGRFNGDKKTIEDLRPPLREALKIWTANYEWFWDAREAKVPRGFWPADLKTSQQTAAVRAARKFCCGVDDDDEEFLDSPARTFVGLGPVGCGKTYAGVGAMRELSSLTRDMAFIPFRGLLRALINPESRAEALQQATETDLILLDDIGGYLKQDSLGEALVEEILLERELDRTRWTILTSNYDARAFFALLGDRVADRLQGDWGCVREVRGPSLRRHLRPAR
jgi:DNA replication protein DnaC/transcriptional regulator with XRE-family HTH domain